MTSDEQQQLGLHNLPAPQGAARAPKRKGRGPGSGLGKTAGRGHKGQRARSGKKLRPGFEGGQMPLTRRVPKRGFRHRTRVANQVVHLRDLERVAGEEVTPTSLEVSGLISTPAQPVKILADGDISKGYVIRGCAVSKAARAKIEQAGGRIES